MAMIDVGLAMNACEIIRRLHAHREWVNGQLRDTVRSLTDEQLHRPFAIGQGSIWKTLTHLYASEYVWLEALLGNERPLLPGDLPGKLPGNQDGAGAIESLDELLTRWEMLGVRWDACLFTLNDASLDDVIYKVSTSSGFGKRHGTSHADVLLHVCTHAQYTTAQLVNMLRQLGSAQLPDVMLITLARQEAAVT
jgi:uncharacterized damage-inducible protein DinB